MRISSNWLAILTLVSACATSADPNAIDMYIQSLPYLPVDPPQVVPGGQSAAARDGDYSCTTENLKETRQLDRIVAYAANSDSLWPGAIVSADSVVSGLFTQVVLPRAPATFSVSLENLGGTKKATIAEPSLSAYRDALASVLQSEITGSTPANIYSEIEEVHSEQQLNMALGVQASWALGLASLKTSFDWQSQNVRSRYVVRYTQAYYTVDLDAPASPSALFANSVSLEDVKAKMNEEHPPAYVSSVTYGRMIVFTFESQYSASELGAALDFAYSGGVEVKGDVSVTYKDILSSSKITAFILGGDAGTAVKTIDSYDSLIDFIKTGGNYTRESPGAPIAYKLSYLKDNSPARMSFTTDYEVKDCVRVAQKIKVTLNSIAVDDDGGDGGGALEIYGLVNATGTTTATLFNKSEGNRVTIQEGKSIGNASQPLGEAVIEVKPQAGQSIRLRANLTEHDPLFNDSLGDETVSAAFETGWRKDVTVLLTGSNARVRVNLSLAPI
ncbi:MAG TPA: thiol-activated cytolysin family protein [Kofleriaceae bacterium]|nr:thiol-activated cytolysin family protein [Kofleriaceae bacterium]